MCIRDRHTGWRQPKLCQGSYESTGGKPHCGDTPRRRDLYFGPGSDLFYGPAAFQDHPEKEHPPGTL